MSQKSRKKASRSAATAVAATDTIMNVVPIGDQRGYLAVGLAAVVIITVGLTVLMIVLAAS